MTKDKSLKHLLFSTITPIILLIVMWGIKVFEIYSGYSLHFLGVQPRSFSGLVGVPFMPLIHGDIQHLYANSFSAVILMWCVVYFYPKISKNVIFWSWIMCGFWTWIIGRESYHIGISGLIYAWFAFLFFSGLFRKDMVSLSISFLAVFLYGSLIWGMWPIKGINYSWEGHLTGFVAGLVLAFYFRKLHRRPKPKVTEENSLNEALYGEDYWMTEEQKNNFADEKKEHEVVNDTINLEPVEIKDNKSSSVKYVYKFVEKRKD